MSDIELGGQTYRIGPLSPMRQFHIVRRLAPVVSAFGALPELADADGDDDGISLDALAKSAGPVVDALGKMSDEDSEYVILNTLRAVERKQGPGWARVIANGRNGEPLLMFEDIDLATLMQLVWHTLRENLARFFPTAAPTSSVATFPRASHS
jgi:hypothetical protein